MKKAISLILALLLCAPVFLSCSETAESETEPSEQLQSANETETTAESIEIDSRKAISDDLPDISFDGQSFRVLTTDFSYNFDYTSEIVSEEITGDACSDAVYNRNLEIEQRFGTKITCDVNSSPGTYISTLVTSGTDEFDIVGMYDFLAYNAISSESVMNWLEIPNINLDKPWHNSLANDSSTINGILYAICSDLSISSMLYTHAFFFNSTLTENFGYSADDIYSLVKEGSWTIDKAIDITSSMYRDLNGDGLRDENDMYGFAYSIWNAADVWLSAFDQPVCKSGDDGIEITLMSDKTVQIVDKLLDWHYNSGCFYNYSSIYEEEKRMSAGTLVFAPIRFKACFDTMRDMEDPYCIIPYPKWDESQSQYLTNADDKFTVFTIPLTATDLNFIGTIYEALCAESYKSVYPVYYDTALKGKYSSDPTTAEMIDLIMAGRNFDFSFQFGESYFNQLPYWVRQCLQNNNNNIATRYASTEKALTKSLEKKLYPLYGLGE